LFTFCLSGKGQFSNEQKAQFLFDLTFLLTSIAFYLLSYAKNNTEAAAQILWAENILLKAYG